MAKFRVTERQVVEYTWEVDDTGLSPEARDNALNAVDGVPEDAHSRLVNSETSFERIEPYDPPDIASDVRLPRET